MDLSRRGLQNLACNNGSRWLVALLLPLALAACGGSGTRSSGVSSVAATTPQAALAAATPKDLVLADGDMGNGWTVVPSGTGAISVAEAVDGDPPAMLKIERPAFRSGYKVLFTNFQRDGAISQIYRYADPTVARSVYDLGLSYIPRRDGLTPIEAPDSVPEGVRTFSGTVKTKNGRTVPLYVAFWLRGRDIGTVAVVGKGSSPLLLVLLVRRQDQRMAARATPGI